MDIEFENLTFKTGKNLTNWKNNQRTLLNNVNGRFKAGELSAILGPSGAGKTTLLNSISGYSLAGVGGELKTNGKVRDESKFRRLSCYITQEDVHVPMLTLNEVMKFAASLKLPTSYTTKQKKTVVEEIQYKLSLSHCTETITHKLSGGEKKRLSIALELINNPPILFLDEPTTGLDNVTTINLLRLLRSLAHQGRAIVCTIHQPSSKMFQLFDQVYVLARGQCIYQGVVEELIPFLSESGFECPTTYNPADYIIELTENDDNIKKLAFQTQNGKISRPRLTLVDTKSDPIQNYARIGDEFDTGDCSGLAVSCWVQFCVLLMRMFLQIRRNKIGLIIQLFNHLFVSITLGVLFYNMAREGNLVYSDVKLCVFIIMFLSYTHSITPILSYPFEIKLLKKEHFNRWYGLCPYYMALMFSKTFFSMIFSTIVYIFVGLPIGIERYLTFCIAVLLVVFTAEGLGYTVGSFCNATDGAIIGPVITTPCLVVAIYGIDFARKVPELISTLSHLSFMRSGLTSFILTMFGMERERLECSDPVYCPFQDPKVILYHLSLEKTSAFKEISYLIMMLIIFRITFYCGLKWRLRT